jgi:hypothetical protein
VLSPQSDILTPEKVLMVKRYSALRAAGGQVKNSQNSKILEIFLAWVKLEMLLAHCERHLAHFE